MKSLACGETGILLKLDIMEGKEANQRKDYAQLYGEGTAVTFRLTQEYYGTGRVVHAVSAFSSVKTLLALQERGLHFMGDGKNSTQRVPSSLPKVMGTWVKQTACCQRRVELLTLLSSYSHYVLYLFILCCVILAEHSYLNPF